MVMGLIPTCPLFVISHFFHFTPQKYEKKM
jgi:hypothetical protein